MPLFAFAEDSGFLCFLFFVALTLPPIVKAIQEAHKKHEEAELKRNNPEIWIKLKELEVTRARMAHDEKVEQHRSARHAAGIGAFILRILTKN